MMGKTNIFKRTVALFTAATLCVSVFSGFLVTRAAALDKESETELIYKVTVEENENGLLNLEREDGLYAQDEVVHITLTPNTDHMLEGIEVQAADKTIVEVTKEADYFTFVMPGQPVNVRGLFKGTESSGSTETNEMQQTETETENVDIVETETQSETGNTSLTEKPGMETDKVDDLDTEERLIYDDSGVPDFKKIFKANGSGKLILRTIDGILIDVLENGDTKTFNYYKGSGAPGEVRIEAVADEGYQVSAYIVEWFVAGSPYQVPESLFNIGSTEYTRGHFLSSAEFDESFTVHFSDSSVSMSAAKTSRAVSDIDNPKEGDVYKGAARVVYNGAENKTYNGTGYIVATSGDFKGDTITMSTCASGHDFAAPRTGQTGTYTITITSINTSTGLVTCTVYWANDSATMGYQNLSGTFSYKHDFEGTLSVYKDMADSLNAFVYPYGFEENLDLRATFGIYSDENATKKVAEVKTDKEGNPKKDEVTLDAGTYYIKELVPPSGFALNETIKKIKIGSGASKSVTVKDRIFRAKVNGTKIDALTGKAVASEGLSLAGAVYSVYGDAACTKLITNGTSDKDGNIEFDCVYFAYGTYYIKETKAPKNYELDSEIYKVVINEELGFYEDSQYRLNDVNFVSPEPPIPGRVKIKKVSSNKNISEGNSCYSIEGAVFRVTNAATGEVLKERLVTKANGETQEIEVLPGTYYIEEEKAPEGFVLDTTKHKIIVEANKNKTLDIENKPVSDPIGVLLRKIDAETNQFVETGDGEFEGAEYTFQYFDGQYTTEASLAEKKPLRTWVLVTDNDGQILLKNAVKVYGDEFYMESGNRVFPIGTYVVKESKAPEGYLLDTTVYMVNITAEFGTGKIIHSYQTSISPEPVIRGSGSIEKWDNETDQFQAQGGATLDGAVFELYNRSKKAVQIQEADKTLREVEVNGLIGTFTTVNGVASTIEDYLPYGTYEWKEIAPPQGYLHTGVLSQKFEIREDGTNVHLNTVATAIKNDPIRYDIKGVKVADGTSKRLSYVPFEIVSDTTGETHIIMTDANGMFSTESSWNPHGQNTNRGTSENDGVWFGDINTLDESKGALLYDTYTLRELPCESNKGYKLLEFKIYPTIRNGEPINLGTLDDPLPEPIAIGTTAKDAETDLQYGYVGEKTSIIDSVSYKNVIVGNTYKVTGTLMLKANGQQFMIGGKAVTASAEFTAKETEGTVDVTFTFDSSALKGQSVVVFENMYQDDELVAAHADIKDSGQTVEYKDPDLGTKAADVESGSNSAHVNEKTIIRDIVSYTDLISGKEYTVKGKLIDKLTGEPLVLSNGKTVTSESTFTAKNSAGTVEVIFELDSRELVGTTVVVFESLEYSGREVAIHADIKDKDQSIQFEEPKLGTTATDKATGEHFAYASEETVIVDVVTYDNLISEKSYILKGVIMDKSTGKALKINGKEVTAQKEFTSKKASGTVEMEFVLNTSELRGKSVVVFENLYYEGRLIGTHSDIKDDGQTVSFGEPKLKTTAAEAKTGNKEIMANGEVTIDDVIKYENLIQGQTYTVKGILMDKKTGKPLKISGKEVTAEKTFKAEKAEGAVTVSFTFDASKLQNKKVVVFETLYYAEKEIAAHADINDKAQTVTFTEKQTTTTPDSGGGKTTSAVKTGDETNMIGYVAMAGAAALAILMMVLRRKRVMTR